MSVLPLIIRSVISTSEMLQAIASWPNLLEAYCAVRSKRPASREASAYHTNYTDGLADIRAALLSGEWTPRPCDRFTVYNYTKRREVEAPAYSDRIVHHAIVQVVEPLFERRFIFDSYSCRKGKGNHAAVDRAEVFLRRLYPCYILQCDLRKFFPSIHHETLMHIVSRTIKDKPTLELIRRAAITNDTGRGIPIGALTSQLLSNVYMDVFDHFIKDAAGIRFYLRYADDFLVFDKDRYRLRDILEMSRAFLRRELKMELNGKSGIYPAHRGLDFCGYRTWPTHRKPRKRVVRGFRSKLREARRRGDTGRVAGIVSSFTAYMGHCDGWRTALSALIDKGGLNLWTKSNGL